MRVLITSQALNAIVPNGTAVLCSLVEIMHSMLAGQSLTKFLHVLHCIDVFLSCTYA